MGDDRPLSRSPVPRPRVPLTRPGSVFSTSTRVWFALHAAVVLLCVCVLVMAIFGGDMRRTQPSHVARDIALPDGFHIDVLISGLPDARSMTLSPAGVLFVGTRNAAHGHVYAIPLRLRGETPWAHAHPHVYSVARGLRTPNGVAYHNGSLYVAEVSKLWRYDGIEEMVLAQQPSSSPPPPPSSSSSSSSSFSLRKALIRPLSPSPSGVLVRHHWPSDDHHGWKFIAFGPDGLLYVPIGAPCNVCTREDARYASIMAINVTHPSDALDRIIAHGVRNTVGFDWDPVVGHMWFTENGRDFASHQYPPDELNVLKRPGQHFGFPYCYGSNEPDPEINHDRNCSLFTSSAANLPPHCAALGARFYQGDQFPATYHNALFFAQHGSWNRKSPNVTGYAISVAHLSNDREAVERVDVFAHGFARGGDVYGRPVDVQPMRDGSLLVSDDYANAIYRITYSDPSGASGGGV